MPLTDKVTLLSLGNDDDQLANAYSLTMRLVEMTKHFKRFDLLDTFIIIIKKTVNATDGSLKLVATQNLTICQMNTPRSISRRFTNLFLSHLWERLLYSEP